MARTPPVQPARRDPGATPLRIVHGSPRDNREGMGRRPSDAKIAAMLVDVEEPTVVGAHIHYPNERDVGDTHVVVVGAVGSPFNGDINAQYGLFTWDEAARRWRFEHRSVPTTTRPSSPPGMRTGTSTTAAWPRR